MDPSPKIIMNKRSYKAVIIISILLLLAGLVGIVLPQFMSLALGWFVGWLLSIAGAMIFYITWHGFRERLIAWLNPLVLISIG